VERCYEDITREEWPNFLRIYLSSRMCQGEEETSGEYSPGEGTASPPENSKARHGEGEAFGKEVGLTRIGPSDVTIRSRRFKKGLGTTAEITPCKYSRGSSKYQVKWATHSRTVQARPRSGVPKRFLHKGKPNPTLRLRNGEDNVKSERVLRGIHKRRQVGPQTERDA